MSLPPPRRRTPPSDCLPVPPAVKTQSCGRQITPVPPSMDLTRRVASSARRSREEEANPSESAHSRGQYLAFLSSPSFRISRWVEALDSRSSRGLPARVMAPERHSCGAVSGALPAPVWPMHIASPLLLIPRTEPPLIQAQRGSLGRGSGAARWPGSGGPTSRFPWICGRAVAADSPPPGPRAAWFPPGPWLPAPGLLARARLRSGSRLPSVLLGCSPVAGARMARLPAGELA